jgi:hypothetical protein
MNPPSRPAASPRQPAETSSLPAGMARAAMRLLLAASDIYAVLMLTYLALRLFSGDRLWPVALLNNFTPWILLPALPVLILLLAARRWCGLTTSGTPPASMLCGHGQGRTLAQTTCR